MEHIYKSMLVKAHSKILYHENFNNPFSEGGNVLKKNMAGEQCQAKKKMKRTGPYTIVEVTAVRVTNSRTNMDIF